MGWWQNVATGAANDLPKLLSSFRPQKEEERVVHACAAWRRVLKPVFSVSAAQVPVFNVSAARPVFIVSAERLRLFLACRQHATSLWSEFDGT